MAEENPLQALEKAVDQYLEKHQINTTKQSIMQALDRYEKKHNDYIVVRNGEHYTQSGHIINESEFPKTYALVQTMSIDELFNAFQQEDKLLTNMTGLAKIAYIDEQPNKKELAKLKEMFDTYAGKYWIYYTFFMKKLLANE